MKLSERILEKKRIPLHLAWKSVMTRKEISIEVAQLEEALSSLVGAGRLGENGWLIFDAPAGEYMYPPNHPYTIAYKVLGDK